ASSSCGGSLSGNTFTTGSVTANCSVSFSSSLEQFTVTASGDTNVTPSPSTQLVNYNETGTITLTVAPGYTAAIASSSCGGSLSGNTFTTGAVTTNCSVSFSSSLDSFTVTPSGDGNETITPNSAQTVAYGATQAFTVTANASYILSTTVGGDCPAGSWSGSTYTTGAVTSNCSLSFSASLEQFTVTASGDTNITPSPTTQLVNYNETGTITLTVAPGYTAAIASNSCGGTLSGNTFTTGAVTANCSVSFSSSLSSFTVTPSGDGNETITPDSAQTVAYGTTQAFTVTANASYILSTTVGGDCPAGSWSENTYTTGAITADCSVSFVAETTYLSVDSTGTIPVYSDSGTPGTLIVTNTGANTAYNVSASLPDIWIGVTQKAACTDCAPDATSCTSIAPGDTCTLNFTSTIPYVARGNISISGDNISSPPTTALAFTINNYLVWDVSGSTAQVIATSDADGTPVYWSVDFFNIPGITETSTVATGNACNGATDGSCDTGKIIAQYIDTPYTYYAAGLCYGITSDNSGEVPPGTWYLPAICQMGGSGQGAGCSSDLPIPNNIDTNLVQLGFGGLEGTYWSSTEASSDPQNLAWWQYFISSSGSNQGRDYKDNSYIGIRCSRAF
ncbi:MAG: hypothetical protein P4L65_08570, partial [Legionella sp.]|nr:hypothetical protein [Legionella sp.]